MVVVPPNDMCGLANWQLHVKWMYFPYPLPPLGSSTARLKIYTMGVAKTLVLEQLCATLCMVKKLLI